MVWILQTLTTDLFTMVRIKSLDNPDYNLHLHQGQYLETADLVWFLAGFKRSSSLNNQLRVEISTESIIQFFLENIYF